MKKCSALLVIVLSLLTSCSFLRDDIYNEDNNVLANCTYKKVIHAIDEKDSAALVEVFSKSVRNEKKGLEVDAEKLFDLVEDSIISFSDASDNGVAADIRSENGKIRKEINYSCRFETDTQKFYIAIRECTRDDFNSDNIGIISLYCINADDWKENYVYRVGGVKGIIMAETVA